MAQFAADHTLVLGGYGYEDTEPYLVLNDIDAGERLRFPVRGRTFTLFQKDERRCVGRFDVEAGTSEVCPNATVLLPNSKETACPACQEATGFNPSFYYALSVSPQQRAYNETPHYAYLAYFSPQYVKAGISSERRGIRRLLEQGARAARVVGRFPDAYAARECEAGMCLHEGIYETMRVSKKIELLVNERYSFEEACAVLNAEIERLGLEGAEDCLDLTPYYFGSAASPSPDELQAPADPADCCGGECVGMVGGALVFRQNGVNYVRSVTEWESHVVEVFDGEVRCTYDFEPMQMSLL